MIAKESVLYRLEIARQHLTVAEKMLKVEEWPSCVSNARVAFENAAKAILACFGPITRTHDTAELLQDIPLQDLPEDMRTRIEEIIPVAGEYGLRKHILTVYGDEETFRTPWALFGEQDALKAIDDARQCVKVAEEVYERLFG